ncbi:myelin basic protein-like [Sinocyclocheilus anshuiensis]|uniref:myelin basic protein-like n=1 Tax=Sinocyclocheilus anshuiensis TaxID=1608454 RepID=UPI0007BAA754|nr:PREDICTED: myelin basic protein-like [Sinocyclocheilus anshuiensis]
MSFPSYVSSEGKKKPLVFNTRALAVQPAHSLHSCIDLLKSSGRRFSFIYLKGSFRGHLSSSPQRPQHSSTRRRGDVNPVVHFFRSFVSSPRPKSRWRELLGLASPSTRGLESIRSPHRRRREQNTLSRIFNLGESRSRSPPKRWSTIF